MNDIYLKIMLDHLHTDGEILYVANGHSMLPTIKDGEKVLIKSKKQYVAGDIVAFYYDANPKVIILHRIILVREKSFFAKGDNNTFVDKIAPLNNIIGYVFKKN